VIELSRAAMIRSTLLKMHKFEEIEFNRPCHGKEGRKEGRNEIVRRGLENLCAGGIYAAGWDNYYCLEDSFTDGGGVAADS
jgi:hypothetical protein